MAVREIQPEGLILPSSTDCFPIQIPLPSSSLYILYLSLLLSGGMRIQGQVCVAPIAAFMAACPAVSQAAPARDPFFRDSGAMIPGGFDIWSQSGERKASSPNVIPFHQRLSERKCWKTLKSKQTKNYQGNKAQERQDKGGKCLEKHFPLLTSLSYVQKACEKYWACDSRNIPKRAVCRGSTINNKALWNLWRFSTKAWSRLLRSRISFNYCTLGYSFKMLLQWKFLSLREGNAALLSFPLIVTGFSTQWMCARTSRSSMSFISSVIFFPFSLTAFKKKKNCLGQGFLFLLYFFPFFFFFCEAGWGPLHSLHLVILKSV